MSDNAISLEEIDMLLGLEETPTKEINEDEIENDIKTCTVINKQNYVFVTQNYLKVIDDYYYNAQKYYDSCHNIQSTKLETRTMTLDPIRGRVFFSPENAFENYNLSNPDYETIMNALRCICKNHFGFTPMQESGANNFEKLMNFINFPFWPQLGSLQKQICTSWPDIALYIENQRLNTNGLKVVFEKLGINIPHYIWKKNLNSSFPYLIEKYLYLKEIGFNDHNIINTILDEYTGKKNIRY